MQEWFLLATGVGSGAAMASVLPEDVMISLELEGDGGGVWTLRSSEDGVNIVEEDAAFVDCRIQCTVDDFRALLDGQLDGQSGFMAGRLRVEGDVGLALRLEGALRPVTNVA